MKKLIFMAIGSMVLMFPLIGCSVQKAASIKKPRYEADLLSFGRPRTHVLAQLGAPQSSEMKRGKSVDTYDMTRNSRGWGIFRSGAYIFLDVGTFGAWELIGNPLEDWIQQDQTVTIYYDENETIARIQYTRQ